MSLRPCQPCRHSRIRCSREVPHCQTCVKRGRYSLCVYETKVSDQKPALPEPRSKQQKQKQERASDEYHFRRRAFEPQSEQFSRYETSTNEEMQHAMEPANEEHIKHMSQRYSEQGSLSPHETPPKGIAAAKAEKASIFQPKHVEDTSERPRSTPVPQPTELYAQMIPPASLPPRPNFDLTISGRHICGPHTAHQLLLVLHYLFISSMLPADIGALWKVICRRHHDWEESFVLQHEQLQQWLISVRNILTNSDGLHTVTLEDIERQTRYILFILGENTSPHSSFIFECFRSEEPPYRPFGVRASIALICHAFGGIQADELEGYEAKEIWTRDQNFLSTMAFRLKESPLFGAEVSVNHLQSMILGLQKAFQCEEIRVSGMEFQTLRIESELEVLGYYRRAFLAFNPILLPKILASLREANDLTTLLWHYQLINMERNLDRTNLALRLANIFMSLAPERLDAAFQNTREIQLSKADRVVAMEMMHVKSFEEAYKLNPTKPTTVRVFHVSP
ncbi:hypothetical protein EN45_044070 [Penicillium chrysogenum]|uniref:Zn(2)-C6 fungal-type domain-containing protein n=2 Tax=Penicillium chrysogenum TaxID=5076 RepID=A0A161ZNI0_PENCH|nr:hypothetical protein EN45_044070 [Penicillium chrysogenum]